MTFIDPTARLRIDLDALTHNFQTLKRLKPTAQLAPVVKADAYGLGAARIARHLRGMGARTFYVARLSEGMDLRGALGPDADIYVLDGLEDGQQPHFLRHRLWPVLNSLEQYQAWTSVARILTAALHIDTGMNRLGIKVNDLNNIKSDIYYKNLNLAISHLACADTPDHPLNSAQILNFTEISTQLELPVSLHNSAGCFLEGTPDYDMTRPGISLYGGGPRGHAHPDLRPVCHLQARILQIKDVGPGQSIGYGAAFQSNSLLKVAVAGIGYADGLPRALAPEGRFYRRGLACRILGRISMDLTCVDVTGTEAKPGEWIDILGSDQGIDTIAGQSGTIAYEVLTGLSSRLPRQYSGTEPDLA